MSTSHSFVVLATRLERRDKDGHRTKYFRGDTISGLSEDDVTRYKLAGAIASASTEAAKDAKDAPESAHPSETSDGPVSEPAKTGLAVPQASELVAEANSAPVVRKPPKVANKAAWEQYAVASGQLTGAQAHELSKAELQELK